MLDDKTIVLVINRYSGAVGYGIPEMNGLYRRFAPGESKKIAMEELRKLSYQPGGEYVLNNYLVIQNEEAVQELIGDVEFEYYYTPKQVQDLLILGSLEQLDDCLTFAPSGVIDLIKSEAVEIKLNDMNKRKLIEEKTGFSVDKAIRSNEYADKAEKAAVPAKTRKAEVFTVETQEKPALKRKAASPKYKVTSISE